MWYDIHRERIRCRRSRRLQAVQAFQREFKKLQASSYDAHQVIGGWVDDQGLVYLELSDVVKSHYIAMELATARNEKAIYDFANAKSIEVPRFTDES